MNRRIAKKITKGPQTICRMFYGGTCRHYSDKYNPTQIKQARAVYFRHHPMGYTDKLTILASTLSPSEARTLLINRWPELREIVLRGTWNKQPTPEADLAFGQQSGVAEIGDLFSDQQLDFVISSLSYFSDRWCWSRVGRVDSFIQALSTQETL